MHGWIERKEGREGVCLFRVIRQGEMGWDERERERKRVGLNIKECISFFEKGGRVGGIFIYLYIGR